MVPVSSTVMPVDLQERDGASYAALRLPKSELRKTKRAKTESSFWLLKF